MYLRALSNLGGRVGAIVIEDELGLHLAVQAGVLSSNISEYVCECVEHSTHEAKRSAWTR